MPRSAIAAVLAGAVLTGAALLLAACTAAPAPTPTNTAPSGSPTPTLAPSACTWTGVRQPVDGGTLGEFAVALTNTSAGTCVLNGSPKATLGGGPHGTEPVGQSTSAGFPAGPVVVPAGATAYAPVVLNTTTDGGIDGHCTDSKHTTLQVTPDGSPSVITLDVSLLHPCVPIPGYGWSIFPVQASIPTVDKF